MDGLQFMQLEEKPLTRHAGGEHYADRLTTYFRSSNRNSESPCKFSELGPAQLQLKIVQFGVSGIRNADQLEMHDNLQLKMLRIYGTSNFWRKRGIKSRSEGPRPKFLTPWFLKIFELLWREMAEISAITLSHF